MTLRSALSAALAVALLQACAEPAGGGSVAIEILGPPGEDPLFAASFVRLRVDPGSDAEVWPVQPGQVIDVGFSVTADGAWHQLHVEGLDAEQTVIARGLSQPIRFDPGAQLLIRVVARPAGALSSTRHPLDVPRVDFALVDAGDAGVLVIGGAVGPEATSSVESVDPWLSEIEPAVPLPEPRRSPAAVVGSDGTVLVVGGGGGSVVALRPDASQWMSVASNAPDTIDLAPAEVGPNSWVLAGGSAPVLGATDQTWTLTWSGDVASLAEGPSLRVPRDRASATPVGGQVLVCGGHGSLMCEWIGGERVEGPPLSGHVAVRLDDQRVLLAGGGSGKVLVVSASGGAVEHSDLAMERRFAAAAPVPDGVLVAGGTGEAADSAIRLSEVDGAWVPTESFALTLPRMRHAALPLPDGNVLLIGGLGSSGGFLARGDVFVP